MKKLIVKSRVDDAEGVRQKLASLGQELGPVVWQHERVYLPHDYRPAANYPRLVMRTEVLATDQPATYALYLKRHIEDSGVDWVNYTSVGDYQEAAGIVHQLGFKKTAEVSRRRQAVWLDPKTVIYLDEVEGLEAAYLKVETEVEEGESVDALRADLLKILMALGQESFLMQTYFDLLRNESEEFII